MTITALARFLAHALELESQAVERYGEMADAMETHNQAEVAGLFREMRGYAVLHRDEIAGIAAAIGGVVKLAPWEFDWGGGAESPESADWDDSHYLMTATHALGAALASEQRAHRYYATVAATTTDAEVQRLAHAFAQEEGGHAALVHQWLGRYPLPDDDWAADPDPPNAGE
jgi:rubrerythrin